MHEGVRRGAAGKSPSLAPIRDDDELDELETMLPWLPAYDRRDALVVWRLLRVLSDKHKRRAKSVSLLQELDEKEVKWALAASCFTAALTKPSPGDPVGSLDVKEWLQQKGIEWPEGRRIRLSTLVAFGWSLFRGCPDMLVCPAGRLRVPTPPSVFPSGGCLWDASAMQPFAEVPAVVQVGGLLACLIGNLIFWVVLIVALLLDLSTHSDGERLVMEHTLWGMSVAAPIACLGFWQLLPCLILLPWLYNYPKPSHVFRSAV